MKPKVHPYVPELQDLHRQGKISRREFMRFAGLLGVTSAAAEALLAGPAPAATPSPDVRAAATADGEAVAQPAVAAATSETSQVAPGYDPDSLLRR